MSAPSAVALREAARRVITLSEELCAAKLEASGLRRHVAGLREDRRHLERKLAAAEAAARELEEGKAAAETRTILGEVGGGGGRGGGGGACTGHRYDVGENLEDVSVNLGGGSGNGGLAGPGRRDSVVEIGRDKGKGALSEEEQRLLAAAALPAEVDFGGLDSEEVLRRLQDAHKKVGMSDE